MIAMVAEKSLSNQLLIIRKQSAKERNLASTSKSLVPYKLVF